MINVEKIDALDLQYRAPPLTDLDRIAQMIVRIDEGGKLVVCRMAGWSMTGKVEPVLAGRICNLLREHAKFEPARDSAGRAIPDELFLAFGYTGPGEARFINRKDAFNSTDYPAAAIREEREGRVNVNVDLDASGKPLRCSVKASSESADLDESTCRIIMARGKFSPVKDRNEKPVAGAWQGTIGWEFANWTATFVDQTLKTIVTLGTDSRPRNCRNESTLPSRALNSTLNCAPALAVARMLIARTPPNTVSARR